MTAGTLTMQISNDGTNYYNGPVSGTFNSPPNLAPGVAFTTNWVYLKDTGSLDINRIWARFSTTDATFGLAEYLKLDSYTEWSSNPAWVGDPSEQPANLDGSYTESFINNTNDPADYLNFWYGRGATDINTSKGYISLADLIKARNAGSGDSVTSLLLFDNTPNPFVPPLLANGTVQVKFTFELLYEVPNSLQGAVSHFRVDFIGSDDDLTYPSPDLNTYITQPLGP
jgi:hypothetical protein